MNTKTFLGGLITVFILVSFFNAATKYLFLGPSGPSSNYIKYVMYKTQVSDGTKLKLRSVQRDLQEKRNDKALDKLVRIIDSVPNNTDMLTLFTLLCLEEKQWDRALSFAERVTLVKPDYLSYVTLGSIYVGKGMNTEAIETLKKGARIRPNDFKVHQMLCKLYLTAGEIDLAKIEFERMKIISNFAAESFLRPLKKQFKEALAP